MQHPLNDSLKRLRLPEPTHKPSLPPHATPLPARSKIMANPVRVPVNKQAAMILRPVRDWLSQSLSTEKLRSSAHVEMDRLRNELKAERNAHAQTRDDLGETRNRLRAARAEIQILASRVERLQEQCAEQLSTIQQLENLKL